MDAKKTDLSDLDRFLRKTAPPAASAPEERREATGRVGLTGEAFSPDPEEEAGSFTEAEENERLQLKELCDRMRDQDHYTILGIDRTASTDAIREAYYTLARTHHPDRYLRPHLRSMHRELELMFAAITDAYGVLSDFDLRQEYDRLLNAKLVGRADKGIDKQASARDAYLRGRKEMESDNIFEAISLFEQAVKLDPSRGEYFYHLGNCQARNPRWKKKAEQNLLKSLDLVPGNVNSYLSLARLYKRGGLVKRSQEMYREVLRWEPDNEEATEALEALKSQGKEAAGGLLGSLFKKS